MEEHTLVHRLYHSLELLAFKLAEGVIRLLINVLLHPGTIISILALYFIGTLLNWLGDAIVFGSLAVYEVLNGIQFTFNEVEKVLDAIANSVGSGINSIGGVFGDSHIVPHVHIPEIDWGKWIPHFKELKHLRRLCGKYENVWYEFTFPLKWVANDHTCPPQRFLWGTWVEWTVSWLPSFNADPMGNNCARDSIGWLCWVIYLGHMIVHFIVPLVIAIILASAFAPFLWQLIKTFEDVWRIIVYGIVYWMHAAFHSKQWSLAKKNGTLGSVSSHITAALHRV